MPSQFHYNPEESVWLSDEFRTAEKNIFKFAHWIFSPSMSKEEKESLQRQNEMMTHHQIEIEASVQDIQHNATQAAAIQKDAQKQEYTAAELVLISSKNVIDATRTLNEVQLADAALNDELTANTQRYDSLCKEFQFVSEQLKELSKTREEDKLIISSLSSTLDLLAKETLSKEAKFEELNGQIIALLAFTQKQTKMIKSLQEKKLELMKENHEMADALVSLDQSNTQFKRQELTLQEMNTQLESYKTLTLSQEKTIKTLQKQKAGLMADNDEITNELELLCNPTINKESAPLSRNQFFR